MKKRILALLTALILVVAVAAACNGDDGDTTTSPTPTPSPTPAASPTPTPSPTPPPPPAAGANEFDGADVTLADLASATQVGVWGTLVSGNYDPALDEAGLLDGTTIFGMFAGAFPDLYSLGRPASVVGLTAAASAGAMTDGTYYVHDTGSYIYVFVMTDDVPAPPPPPGGGDTPGPAPGTPDATSMTLNPTASDVTVTMTGVYDGYGIFDLSALGIPGLVYYVMFEDGGTVTFSEDVTLTYQGATTREIAAGETVTVDASISEFALPLGDGGDSLLFLAEAAPGNFAGMALDQAFSTFPGTVS